MPPVERADQALGVAALVEAQLQYLAADVMAHQLARACRR